MQNKYNTRKTLLLKLKDQRDDLSWTEFHKSYHRYICAILWNMKINEAHTEDILQTVMLKIWNSLPDFDYEQHKGRFRNWISVITANTAKNYMQKENRLYSCLNGDKSGWLDDFTKSTLPPEIEEISSTEWEKFISALAWENVSKNLSDTVKTSFEELLKGKSTREVANQLNIEENTVIVYKNRVKNKMLLEITHLQNEMG